MQSLKGQALAVTTALPPDTTWEKLLQALKIKYQEKAPYDVIMTLSLKLQILLRIPILKQILKLLLNLILLLDLGKVLEERKVNLPMFVT